MAKILIVDDQKGMRDALRAILQQGGHIITDAENGRAAQAVFKNNSFDLVISDFQMPQMDGVELLAWIKSEKKETPVILVTAFAHILETQKAFQLGASDFLTKPFTRQDILQSVNKVLNLDPTPAEPIDPGVFFCKIPIEDFVSGAGVQVNIYVKLSDQKYVRVAHKGDQVPIERVDTYRTKGLNYLYARKDEFAKLVGFSLDVSKILQSNKTISPEKRLRFVQYTSELILENAKINGIDARALRQANDCVELCISVLADSHNLFELLDAISNHGDWIYRHSLAVGTYSVMIGRKMGWTGQNTLFKLSTAGLFHDVGEKEIDENILHKARPAMTVDERKLFETHPTRGRQILLESNDLPEDIIQVVYESHEEPMGQGFPRQLSKEKIHPLAKVINVSDKFCTLAIPGPRSKGASALEAMAKMEQMYEGEMDKAAFLALKSLCNQRN